MLESGPFLSLFEYHLEKEAGWKEDMLADALKGGAKGAATGAISMGTPAFASEVLLGQTPREALKAAIPFSGIGGVLGGAFGAVKGVREGITRRAKEAKALAEEEAKVEQFLKMIDKLKPQTTVTPSPASPAPAQTKKGINPKLLGGGLLLTGAGAGGGYLLARRKPEKRGQRK